MYPTAVLDCAGRHRSPAIMSRFHQGRPPRDKGLRYPPDPPTVEKIIAVMPGTLRRMISAATAALDARSVASHEFTLAV